MKLSRVFVVLMLVALVFCRADAGASHHRLAAGDFVKFTIYLEDDITTEARIEADGYIVLPLVGKIAASGLTVGELNARLFEAYDGDYFINPQIGVTVLKYAKRRVRVWGQVSKPGTVSIPPEQGLSLADAIAEAGGFTRRADEKRIVVMRAVESGDEKKKIFELDLSKVTSSASLRGDDALQFQLEDNDTIVVPESLF